MPVYEVEAYGETFEVEAPDLKRAQSSALLYVARNRMTKQAEAVAMKSREMTPAQEMRDRMERLKTVDPEKERALELGVRAAEVEASPYAMTALASVPLAGGAIAAPLATAKGALGALVGSAAGKEAGEWVGRRVPLVGGETAGNVLGAVGGLVGGGVGASTVAKVGPAKILQMATGGRLGPLLGAAEAKPAQAMSEAVRERLAIAAKNAASRERAVAAMERRVMLQEQKAAAKLAGGPPAAAPPAPPVPTDADMARLILGIRQQMGTKAGRAAVREWISQQPKEVGSQIRLLLARGQAHPATVMTPTPAQVQARQPGYELAKMLGQVQ